MSFTLNLLGLCYAAETGTGGGDGEQIAFMIPVDHKVVLEFRSSDVMAF